MGYARAADLVLRGGSFKGAAALQAGLATHLVEPGACLKKAMDIAAEIASKPPRAVRVAKRLMRNAERMDLPDFLNSAAAYQALMHQTEDHHEAVAAFVEKRKPNFTGR